MSENKYNIVERSAFIIMIIGMAVAGYAYQTYKDTVPKIILVTVIIASLVLLLIAYRLALRLMAGR